MAFSTLRTNRPTSLRSRILVPLLVATLPLALFAAIVVSLLSDKQREQVRDSQLNNAQALAVAVRSGLDSTVRHLKHMATSPLLVPQSMGIFRERCVEVIRIRDDWLSMSLIDRNGRQVFNTLYPDSSARPNIGGLPHVKAAFETEKTTVSDLVTTSDGLKIISVSTPVIQEGRVVYVLQVILKFEWFDTLLRTRVQDGAGALLDSRLRFISRSIEPDSYRGQPPVQALVDAMRNRPEGRAAMHTLEGVPVNSIWVSVPDSGWKIAIGYPQVDVGNHLKGLIGFLIVTGSMLFALAVGFAIRTSSRMTHLIKQAAKRAAAVADGKLIIMRQTGMTELDQLELALEQASQKVRHAERERDAVLRREQVARAAAEDANRAKDDFLAMLSHELRNPVGAIGNSVALLQTADLPVDKQQVAQSVIARQAAHLSRLLDDLLDVARVISGKVRLRSENLDLCVKVNATVDAIRAAGYEHEIIVDACEPVFVHGDRTRIEQVIWNLLRNAVSYSPAGSTIHISVRNEAGDATLTVSDHGAGIPAADQGKIFDLFFQGNNDLYRTGGLGIGLTLVKRIVELHGGLVRVESDGADKGSTFIVRLPVATAGPAPDAPRDEATAARLRILVVDDNEDGRQSLALLLQIFGHDVRTAHDGKGALETALHEPFDLAFIDIGMPEMDGYQVAATLRTAGLRLFLVAHTGYGQQDDLAKAQAAGFDTHLIKPADAEKLREILKCAAAAETRLPPA